MFKQLIIVLVVVGVVLCQENEQQQNNQAGNKLMDLLNGAVKNAGDAPQAVRNNLMNTFDQFRQNPAFAQVMNAIATNPIVQRDVEFTKQQLDKLVEEIKRLMPQESADGKRTPIEDMLAVVLLMLRGPSGGR